MNTGGTWSLDSIIYCMYSIVMRIIKENYNYLSLKMAEIILQGMIVLVSKTTQEASLKFDSEHKTGSLSSRSLIKEKT